MISVLIPCYLRSDDLTITLSKLAGQTYSNFEVIVIDDGTPGDNIEKAVNGFPHVRYVRLDRNVGLISARNIGARQCSGEYIVNLDDDSWLEDDEGLAQIARFMEDHPRCGAAALNIRSPGVDRSWPETAAPQVIRTYTGCGNVYRRSILGSVGDYVPEFYRQGEEVERSLRIRDAGYDVMSAPHIKVYHSVSPINRNRAKHLSFEGANYLRRELIRAPGWLLPLGVTRAVVWMIRNRKTYDRAVLVEEIFGGRVPLLKFVRNHRKPISTRTYFRSLELR